ncbi:MAG: hypothetical protein QOF59_1201 [Actinomycetota bacterium]|jgi:hypothetical protein|nr:hypothetical protein [Actinomycetota bacterium]MDQ1479138.1 hypothetical protein [Actinomycetota bacterium]
MNAGPNWARRYGPNHRRLCARPGCGAPAAATLRFQPTQREAWLVDLDADAVRTEGDLCARHAAGLVLPRGWELHNDLSSVRDETTRPAPPARRARGASVARARRRRTASTAVELPGLAAVGRDPEPSRGWTPVRGTQTVSEEPAPNEPAAPSEPAQAPAPPPAPLVAEASPEANVELAETLDAQTPLLKRAFRNALPDDNS